MYRPLHVMDDEDPPPPEASTEGAIWPGNTKWQINNVGEITPCSLKKLTVSYICENLGSLCNINCEDPRTICYRKPNINDYSNTKVQEEKEGCSSGGVKSACDKEDFEVLARANSHSSFSESSIVSSSRSNGMKPSTSTENDTDITSLIQSHRVLPYTKFNVPNYGKVYDKSNDIEPPGVPLMSLSILKKDPFYFKWR